MRQISRIVLGLFAATLVNAQSLPSLTSPQLRNLQEQLREARSVHEALSKRTATLEGELQNLSSEEAGLRKTVNGLEANISSLEATRQSLLAQIRTTETKRHNVEVRIQALEAEIARLEQVIEEQKRAVARLIVQLNRERSARYVQLLSRATTLYELAIDARLISKLGNQDLSLITSLEENVERLDRTKNTLEGERNEYLKLIAQLNQEQRELIVKTDALKRERNTLQSRVTALRNTQRGRQVLLYQALRTQAQASSDMRTLLVRVSQEQARLVEIRRLALLELRRREEEERRRRLEAEARIQAIRTREERERQQRLEQQRRASADQANAQEQARIAALPILPSQVPRLSFPMTGGAIATNFGGTQDYITIRANAEGAPVFAAADGIIIRAGFVQANSGFTVIVQHTSNFYTAYENLQQPVVANGQRVSRGNLLGYVGGGFQYAANELHFKVGVVQGVNFSWVNPNAYF